jgi:hypothetical protein
MVSGTDPSKATISIQGTLYGIIFKKTDLTAQVAGQQTVSEFGAYTYDTPGLESLTFAITNPTDFSPIKKNALIIHLKGDMKVVGIIPVAELKQKLAGIPLAQTQEVLKPYDPVIESGSGELIPPWSNVPSDTSRITINVTDK